MPPWRALLAISLITLLLAFSFNAYACLLPLYGGVATPQGSACSAADEQPARQFCDTYKILGIPAASDLPLPTDEEASLLALSAPQALLSLLPDRVSHPVSANASPPLEPPLRSSVLRI